VGRARFKYFTRLIDGIAALVSSTSTRVEEAAREGQETRPLRRREALVPVKYRNRYGKVRTYDTTYAGIVTGWSASATKPTGLVTRAGRAVHARGRVSHVPRATSQAEILAVKVHGHNIAQVNSMTIDEAIDLFAKLKLTKREETIARRVIKEIVERLTFLMDVDWTT